MVEKLTLIGTAPPRNLFQNGNALALSQHEHLENCSPMGISASAPLNIYLYRSELLFYIYSGYISGSDLRFHSARHYFGYRDKFKLPLKNIIRVTYFI